MRDFRKYLDQQMSDPEFAAEFEAQRPEYEAIRAVIAARLESHMTKRSLQRKPASGNPTSAALKMDQAARPLRHWPALLPGLGSS